MAERRMFAKTIIDSDAFLDMPLSAQALYFHLSMRADDDGFINNPKKTQRMIGCNDDDLKLLTAKKFIIPFESGIVVIKHWKIHNYIQKDRYKETVYRNEKNMLIEKNNKAYSLCIQDGYSLDSQVRLGKVRLELGKDRLGESEGKPDPPQLSPCGKLPFGEFGKVLLTDKEYLALKKELGEANTDKYIKKLDMGIEEKGYKTNNHFVTIRKWFAEDQEKEIKEYPGKKIRNLNGFVQ